MLPLTRAHRRATVDWPTPVIAGQLMDVHRLDLPTRAWTLLSNTASFPGPPRSIFGFCVPGNGLFVFGGSTVDLSRANFIDTELARNDLFKVRTLQFGEIPC